MRKYIIALGLLLTVASLLLAQSIPFPGPGMTHGTGAVTLVTSSGRTGCASGGASCVITTTGTGHGLFALLMTVHTSDTFTGITDGGDTWTQVPSVNVSCQGQTMDIWYTPSTGGARTGIIATTTSGTAYNVWVYETTGTNASSPVDQHATQTSSGINATGAPVTTTAASELIISQVTVAGAVSAIFGGNAFTNDSIQNVDGWAHLITSATGTYQAQWTSTGSGTNCSNTASFKP